MQDYSMMSFLYKIEAQQRDRKDRLEIERCRTCLEDVITTSKSIPLISKAYEHLDYIDLGQKNLY